MLQAGLRCVLLPVGKIAVSPENMLDDEEESPAQRAWRKVELTVPFCGSNVNLARSWEEYPFRPNVERHWIL